MQIIKETSPHLKRRDNLMWMLLDVIIALAPTLVFAFVVYRLQTLMVYGIAVGVMVLGEFIAVLIKNKLPFDGQKHSFKEKFSHAIKGYKLQNLFAPIVSALIFTLIMPSGTTWYATLIGATAGIVFGKLVFGGTGYNIFNPAAIGLVVAKVSFPKAAVLVSNDFVNVQASGTMLSASNQGVFSALDNYSILDLFLGKTGGTLGEGFKITILVGMIYLLIRRDIDFRAMVGYLASFLVLVLIGGIVATFKLPNFNPFVFTLKELLAGGVLFGAVFMITDPVTMPMGGPARWLYGVFAGGITVLIRFFGSLPEGVAFSILIANCVAPALDYYKWSSPKWKKWHYIALLSYGVLVIAILVLALTFGGFIK